VYHVLGLGLDPGVADQESPRRQAQRRCGAVRAVAQQLPQRLKQQAESTTTPTRAALGSEKVAKAPPSGYLLLLAS
jgi:hypothetical protein